MSAAFNVRKPYPTKSNKPYNTLSRDKGPYKQPEYNNNNSNSSNNQQRRTTPYQKPHSHKQHQAMKRKTDAFFADAEDDNPSNNTHSVDSDSNNRPNKQFKSSNRLSRNFIMDEGEDDIEPESAPVNTATEDNTNNNNNDYEEGSTSDEDSDSADDSNNSDSEPIESTSKSAANNTINKKSRTAPQELSSKVPISRHQHVIGPVKTYKPLDPRFSTTAGGEFKPGQFKSAYQFLDDYKRTELTELKQSLKSIKSIEDRSALRSNIKSQQSALDSSARNDRQRSILSQWKKQEKLLEASGKRPFYLKKSTVKQMMLADQYIQLQSTGKLDSKLEKKRKQQQQKQQRYMPRQQKSSSNNNNTEQ